MNIPLLPGTNRNPPEVGLQAWSMIERPGPSQERHMAAHSQSDFGRPLPSSQQGKCNP